jgi:hypothetical protein
VSLKEGTLQGTFAEAKSDLVPMGNRKQGKANLPGFILLYKPLQAGQ